MLSQLKVCTTQEEAAPSSPKLAELDALSKVLTTRFFEAGPQHETFRAAITKFDRFLHVDLLDRYSEDDLPRFHFAIHSTDKEIVLDYPEDSGLGPILMHVFTEVARRLGYDVEIQMRRVMTIRGSAKRFLIELN